jgi:DNA-binding ferritin-like protein
MKIPYPNEGEKQADFVNRCMKDSAMIAEYYQNEHRFSVCNNCWEKSNLEKNSTAFEIDVTKNNHKPKLAKADADEDYSPASIKEAILTNMLQMQQQYRIYHWQTKSYAEHKAFNKIYNSLDEHLDDFIEAFMGKYGRMVESPMVEIELFNYKDAENCVNVTDTYIAFLTALTSILPEDTDLLNIRDTIKGELNQLKYLLTLK